MDYTKVISTVKKYAFAIADFLETLRRAINQGTEAIKTDVAGVKNAFDAWKADWTQARAIKLDNLDAKISSRASSQAVDGVQLGVETTLQRLTALEGSVNPLDLQPNVIVREIYFKGNGVILNVSGKGKLLCAGIFPYGSCDIEVNMDERKKLNLNFYSSSDGGGCYICQSYILARSHKDNRHLITSFGDILCNYSGSKFIADEDEFSYMYSYPTLFTSYKPIVFNTKLTVTVKNNSDTGQTGCLVAYIIDQN